MSKKPHAYVTRKLKFQYHLAQVCYQNRLGYSLSSFAELRREDLFLLGPFQHTQVAILDNVVFIAAEGFWQLDVRIS